MVIELLHPDGVLLRRDVIAAGYDDAALLRQVRSGALHRVRQGAYAMTESWRALAVEDQHRLLCAAVLRLYDDEVALSHDSAVLAWEGPSHGLALGSVHLAHLGISTGHRNAAGVIHHRGECRVGDVSRRTGGWVTSPARTVIDVALAHGFEVGVVVADDLLRRGLTTKAELWMRYESMKSWPGALVVRMVIAHADPASESVGETLGRLLFRRLGLPTPVLQYEVLRPDGSTAGRTDWAWPEYGLLGEFDGRGKYLRWMRPGEDAAAVVVREKLREDELREITGWRMIRLEWADLHRVERTARRLSAALRIAA